jgi:nucleoside-diphosphate-sugar epimerase
MKRILITGATGQIGTPLTLFLRDRYGAEEVIAGFHRTTPCADLVDSGPCVTVEVRDYDDLEKVVREYEIDTIFHLAALLSAVAEENPQLAWEINMNGLRHVLEVARAHGCAVFFPSSIGAFGPTTPAEDTPQDTIQRPRTMYGITKVSGELLCEYYFHRYGVDTRGLRYPGLISYETLPGGGTTDYAVEIFYAALTEKSYGCFLDKGTRLDLMYMPDAVRAAVELMEAEGERLRHRNAFNVAAMSVAPEDLFAEIRKVVPAFTMTYDVDPVRQAIAEGWPRHMDDQAAREEWGWRPQYDLAAMTVDMIAQLSVRLRQDDGLSPI